MLGDEALFEQAADYLDIPEADRAQAPPPFEVTQLADAGERKRLLRWVDEAADTAERSRRAQHLLDLNERAEEAEWRNWRHALDLPADAA
jgi:hypothetical protein